MEKEGSFNQDNANARVEKHRQRNLAWPCNETKCLRARQSAINYG